MTDRPRVVITDYDYGSVDIERGVLEAAGAEVVALQAKSEDDLLNAARECSAIMTQYERVGARTISVMERCKVIARYGIGVDTVDVAAATKKGILVTNVQGYCTEEVADHVISLWLALARGLFAYNCATHRGIWCWQSAAPLHRLAGQTIGIVSFGRIGQAIAARARAFKVNILTYDPYLPACVAEANNVLQVDKRVLLTQSDVVVMQAPLTPETRHFLGEAEFRLMKRGTIVINTGRGPTIDYSALYKALSEGWIAGAGLDDLEEEPAKRASWSPEDYPVFSLSNVIVTPHAAYYSEESIRSARETAASEVVRVLTGQAPQNPVNAGALGARALIED